MVQWCQVEAPAVQASPDEEQLKMVATLDKIKNLERIYIDGYGDDFMD